MADNNKEDSMREIRITGVSKPLAADIKNISQHIGITQASFLKMKLREIADSYPEKMKRPMDRV